MSTSKAWWQDALENVGLSKLDLARTLGVQPSTVDGWIGGIAAPALQRVPLLAETLGIARAELLIATHRDRLPESWSSADCHEWEAVVRHRCEISPPHVALTVAHSYVSGQIAARAMGELSDVATERIAKLMLALIRAKVRRDIEAEENAKRTRRAAALQVRRAARAEARREASAAARLARGEG